jgi:uncharacterized protein (TIGR03435 family)
MTHAWRNAWLRENMRQHTGKFVLSLAVITTAAIPLLSQAPPTQKPSFEVASIKPNTTGQGTLIETPPTGRVNIISATFRTLLRTAYRVQDYQVIGGPDWLAVDRFDIQARPPADYQPQPFLPCVAVDCPPTPVQIMMQGLLADRFRLKIHRETRELPVYELTIGKNGFKLKEVSAPPAPAPGAAPPRLPPPPPPGTAPPTNAAALPTPPPGVTMGFPFGLAASAVPLATLDSVLAEILRRPVVDKTGIKGYYDFKIVYSRDGIPSNGPAPPPPVADGGPGLNASDPRPSIFTALEEELGLKLESAKGPVEVLVIDSVQKPSEN